MLRGPGLWPAWLCGRPCCWGCCWCPILTLGTRVRFPCPRGWACGGCGGREAFRVWCGSSWCGTWWEMHCPGRVLGVAGSGFWGDVWAVCPPPSSNPGSQQQPELPLPQEHPSLHPPGAVQQRRGVARGEQLPAPGGGVSGSRGCVPSAPTVFPEFPQFRARFRCEKGGRLSRSCLQEGK